MGEATFNVNRAEWVQTTIANDPFNLLAGFATLEQADSVEAIETYCNLCKNLKTEYGLAIIAPDNVPLVYLFLKARSQSELLFDPLQIASIEDSLTQQQLENLSAFNMASYALSQTCFGRQRQTSTDTSWKQILYAETIRAARVRDINAAGLTLLSSSLLLGENSPAELPEWFQRIKRRDNLFGCWELFSDSVNIANLLSTVNAYWGLHACNAPEIPLYPGITQGRK